METKDIDIKMLSLSLILCIGGGLLSGFISGMYGDYESFIRPEIYPPGWVFSGVWTILYFLMGISLYLILSSNNSKDKKIALAVFGIQLIMNFAWSPVFFIGSYYLAALILLIAIFISVLVMIWAFEKVNRLASNLQLPYVVWLCVALYLSYSVYVLN